MKPAAADAAANVRGSPTLRLVSADRFPQLSARLPLSAVTDAELDREIGSQPDA